ncbi:hypothetical protein JVT61DRAFT_5933 [Boletus reticuloceps]|uniref:Uncharacterized protein n=1 Tax=Boletus reticuloceps TaxID=495285 RepID=A0A8I3A885_9AGAM|nr:hypothetical protein JVT61DRAFT_5933 [Boletus reticuloceps]
MQRCSCKTRIHNEESVKFCKNTLHKVLSWLRTLATAATGVDGNPAVISSEHAASVPLAKLKLKAARGLRVHRKNDVLTLRPMARHTKIWSDDLGHLHFTKTLYKARKGAHTILTQPQVPALSGSLLFDPVNHPPCVDNLPETVDLGILGYTPRERTAADVPILGWLERDREDFLQELIRLEGRNGIDKCTSCNTHYARYCCKDCVTLDLYCTDCLLLGHINQPLHRIKVRL